MNADWTKGTGDRGKLYLIDHNQLVFIFSLFRIVFTFMRSFFFLDFLYSFNCNALLKGVATFRGDKRYERVVSSRI